MAMLIFALASFSIATELPSESPCFDCKKVVETKNPYWPCAGLKVNFRKVSQEAASEASNKICCYQAGKRMNSKIAFTECEDLKKSWSEVRDCGKLIRSFKERGIQQMCCFVILLLFNEMQMSVRRFSAIPHLREELELSQQVSGTIGLGLSSVSRCLDTLMKHSHSFLKYYANVTINKKE